MPPKSLPVDFGVLPYSSAAYEQSTGYSTPRGNSASILNTLPPHQRLGLQLAEAFAMKMEWTGIQWSSDRTAVLDYQCGTGLMSQILAPYVKYIVGIDTSSTNVDEYNRKAHSQRLYPDKVRGYIGDLCTQSPDPRFETRNFFHFDVVIIGPGFHRSAYPQVILMHVIRRLKVGGTLLVMDYASPYQGYASTPDQYRQYGFMKSELGSLLEQQGLLEATVDPLTDSQGTVILEAGGHRQLVLAKGVKPGQPTWNA